MKLILHTLQLQFVIACMNNRLIKITSNDVGDFLDSSGMLELAKNDCADCGNFDI